MLEAQLESSLARAQRRSRIGDAMLLGIAASAAAVEHGAFHWKIALSYLVMATLLWLLESKAMAHYSEDNGRSLLGDLALTLVLITGVVAPIALLILLLPAYGPSLHPGRSFAALVPTAVLWRLSTVGAQLWKSRRGLDVLVVGIGPLGRLTGDSLTEGRPHHELVGYLRFQDEAPHARLHAPLLGTAADLEATLRNRAVDEVYFAASTGEHGAEVQTGIRTCETLGVPFALPACAFRLERASMTPRSAIADGYSHFQSVPLKPTQWLVKRFFDIAASFAALAVLSPLLLITAALVKLTSKGPVLFRQERAGLRGRSFHMLKFRSMVDNAEALRATLLAKNEQTGPVFKMKRDPRVTAFGRFMRKHSIDELPQLLNVLRGDMSVVGPRPPLPGEVALYEAWQLRRLSVRPGLTCVWQVSGRNGISFQDWVLLDMRYIDNFSLAGDLQLILQTLPVVLSGRGAS